MRHALRHPLTHIDHFHAIEAHLCAGRLEVPADRPEVGARIDAALDLVRSPRQGEIALAAHTRDVMAAIRGVLALLQNASGPCARAAAQIAIALGHAFELNGALQESSGVRLASDLPPPPAPEDAATTPAEASLRETDPVPLRRRRVDVLEMAPAIGLHSESNFFVGLSTEPCEPGLFIATYRLPPVGTPVRVRLALPVGPEVSLVGVVEWIRDASEHASPGVGIRLQPPPASTRHIIEAFMRLRDPLLFDV